MVTLLNQAKAKAKKEFLTFNILTFNILTFNILTFNIKHLTLNI